MDYLDKLLGKDHADGAGLEFITDLLPESLNESVRLDKKFKADAWLRQGLEALARLEKALDEHKPRKEFWAGATPYWFCAVFERQEQKEVFIEKAWPTVHAEGMDKYIDGIGLARDLGIILPACTAKVINPSGQDEEILAVSDKLILPAELEKAEADRKAQIAATKRDSIFKAAQKRRAYLDMVNEKEYWFCVCFGSFEQRDFFIETLWAGEKLYRGSYLDGMKLAARMGIALPLLPFPPSTVRLRAQLAELAMTLEEAAELAARRRARQEIERKSARARRTRTTIQAG